MAFLKGGRRFAARVLLRDGERLRLDAPGEDEPDQKRHGSRYSPARTSA